MERILSKSGRIREHLALVRSIQDECLERFTRDPIYRGALLHYLYLIADGCVVLAGLVIRHRKLRIPQSYAESFDILGESGILDPAFAYKFSKIAGFRNFLAHDYERIDPVFICQDVLARLEEIEQFLDSIHKTFTQGTDHP